MYEYEAIIRSVHDGDSIRCDVSLGFGIWTSNQPLRLLGIDAPELGTPEGRAARDYLRSMLPVGQEVVIHTVKDATEKYGRLLADVYVPAEFTPLSVNRMLIDAGHAKPYDGGSR